MQHLFQSAFLQALGYAIANSLWQTALVWLIYMSITGLTSISAAAKYRLAVAAQVTGFVWFIITFRFYFGQYNDAWQQSRNVPQNIQAILSSHTDLSSTLINWMVKGEQLLPYVSTAYLLLMLFLCIRWFLGYRQTQLIRNNGLQKIPAEWRLFVNRIAGQLQITKKIQVFLSDTVTTPLTIGFLKPVILIPVASINHLTTDQLEAVLLHELAHIKRYDYLVNILLSVVEISLFFNPFTQLLSKSIRKERENSCDDWVLQFQYDASLYAEALLRIAYLQSAPAFAMAATGKKNELLVRVKRMIEKKENHFSYRRQLLAFIIVTGILCSVAWLNPMAPHAEHSIHAGIKQSRTKNPYEQPMAVRVDNPLFNPVFFLSEPLKAKMKKDIASAQKEIDEIALEESHPIESFTPLITGALDQVSKIMSPQNAGWEKSIAKMEAAEIEFDKKFRSDTGLIDLKMKRRIKEDMGMSMEKMKSDLLHAKAEMQRSFKMTTDIGFDKEKVQLDMLKVLESLKQLNQSGLDKVVLNALKLVLPAEEESGPRQRMKQPSLRRLDSKPETKLAPVDKTTAATQIVLSEEAPDEINPADDVVKTISTVRMQLPRLVELDKIKIDLPALIKIKNYLLRQAAEENKKIRMVPVLYKDKTSEETGTIMIQLQ